MGKNNAVYQGTNSQGNNYTNYDSGTYEETSVLAPGGAVDLRTLGVMTRISCEDWFSSSTPQ